MSRFRVLQFNMQFGQQWADAEPDTAPIDLAKTIDVILAQRADLILLQEVERALPGGPQAEPPPNFTRLQAALPEHFGTFTYPRPDPRELPFGFGLAIFSRAPLTDVFRRDLPSPPVSFTFFGTPTTPTDRVLLGAYTTLGGRRIRVINTHLLAFFMLKSSSEVYGDQRAQVVAELAAAYGPTLLTGDFNVSNTASLVGQMAAAGFTTVQDREITWRRRPMVLDHVLYRGPLRPVAHTVTPTPTSDHHLLVADFEWTA